ncbi:MBL fold metallo-hydrolase [Desertivirga brevis]|uniref:MBL fold metallo-hydrolase n=1 Tax=Desertivirga brevis TaxID=2810310 RepID=UPI001A95A2D1|nr:MBL fold metallo-hydrolase [Pedobacter sp. SYSU D00873]
MKIQLWRNATVLLELNNKRLLLDPMLGAKGSMGLLPMIKEQQPNPLVDLPFSARELEAQLQHIDAVLLTHLHPDHWDLAAQELISKELPIICSSLIAPDLNQQGFQNILVPDRELEWEGIQFSLTEGRHGSGEIGAMMGTVNGFVIKSGSEAAYFAGDTIWYEEINSILQNFKPAFVVLNGGAAQFDQGEPILMTSEEIILAAQALPSSKFYIVHLEALSHAREDRGIIKSKISQNGLQNQCFVPADGEVIDTSDGH